MLQRRHIDWSRWALLAGTLAACGGPKVVPQAPVYSPRGQTKCSIAKSVTRPLVVEWAAVDRAELEAIAHRQPVVVHYEGCTMNILPACRAPGAYRYTAVTPKRERIIIRDDDQLYSNLPLGAARLEGKLHESGALDVDLTVAGRFEASAVDAGRLEGECARATHVVTAYTTGAFTFSTGASSEAGGAIDVGSIGAQGRTTSARETLNADGERASCEGANATADSPPFGCGAILRLELSTLDEIAAERAPRAPLAGGSSPGGSGPGGLMIVTDDPKATYKVEATTLDGVHSCADVLTPLSPCTLPHFAAGPVHVTFDGDRSFAKDVAIRPGDPARMTLSHRDYLFDGVFYGGLVAGAGLMIAGAAGGAWRDNPPGASLPVFVGGTGLFFLDLCIGGFFMLVLPPHDYVTVEQPGLGIPAQYAHQRPGAFFSF